MTNNNNNNKIKTNEGLLNWGFASVSKYIQIQNNNNNKNYLDKTESVGDLNNINKETEDNDND
jgi:3'-phosphoadenosine 5'-phosphosulfate sulfotransferase (PAPS reductase)/FAD synthetase